MIPTAPIARSAVFRARLGCPARIQFVAAIAPPTSGENNNVDTNTAVGPKSRTGGPDDTAAMATDCDASEAPHFLQKAASGSFVVSQALHGRLTVMIPRWYA
jgi:hypothetical protein